MIQLEMPEGGDEQQHQRRRAFVRAETLRLGRFLDESDVVAWGRSYRCDCGFSCTSPGEIWDHTLGCPS